MNEKKSVVINVVLPAELKEALDRIQENFCRNRSDLIREGIVQVIDRYSKLEPPIKVLQPEEESKEGKNE